jgi:hypothetical protein
MVAMKGYKRIMILGKMKISDWLNIKENDDFPGFILVSSHNENELKLTEKEHHYLER